MPLRHTKTRFKSLIQHFSSIMTLVVWLSCVFYRSVHWCLVNNLAIYPLIFILIFAILGTACLFSYYLVAESHSFSWVQRRVAGWLRALLKKPPFMPPWHRFTFCGFLPYLRFDSKEGWYLWYDLFLFPLISPPVSLLALCIPALSHFIPEVFAATAQWFLQFSSIRDICRCGWSSSCSLS